MKEAVAFTMNFVGSAICRCSPAMRRSTLSLATSGYFRNQYVRFHPEIIFLLGTKWRFS